MPSQHWRPGTVDGRPALLAPPLLANGFGHAAIIVYHDGILTIAETTGGIPFDEFTRIVEGIFP